MSTAILISKYLYNQWIATATSLYLTHAFLSGPTSPNSLSHHLDVSTTNKNHQVISPKAKSVGLDMNRNWRYKWQPDIPASASNFTKLIIFLSY